MAAPNARLVGNLVAGLDIALDNLISSHMTYVMKMNAQLSEARFTQYITKLEDAADEVKAIAEVVPQSVDQDGVPIPQVDGGRLKQD